MNREQRYTVLKIADVSAALSADEAETLIALEEKVAAWREAHGKQPLECVVVEKDWPEYEPTWAAIEMRVSGVPYGHGDPQPKWGFRKSCTKHSMDTLYSWLAQHSSGATCWDLMREIRNKDICDLEKVVIAKYNREPE